MNTSSRWQRLALSLAHRKPAETTQGLTLVECIMAIAVIALTTAMITPPLFLAAATRMQNQRAEQAMQIAQGEVDRIRFLVETQQHNPARLPAVSARVPIGRTDAPTGLSPSVQSGANCGNAYRGQQLAVGQALRVDITGDCQADFAVQMFRTAGVTPPGELVSASNPNARRRPGAFCLVVRVYSKPAIDSLGSVQLEIEPASLRFTSGQGNQRTRPLAVMTTPMIWGDRNFSSRTIQASGNNICR